MTDQPAVLASYVKMSTLVDGTMRVVLDIEPKSAADAFALLGSPGTAIAIARITKEAAVAHDRRQQEPAPAAPAPAPEKKPLSLASKVAMTCRQPTFQAFLRQEPGLLGTLWCDARNEASANGVHERDVQAHALAETAVKRFCGVARKRDLAEHPGAVTRWEMVEASYHHWQRRAA